MKVKLVKLLPNDTPDIVELAKFAFEIAAVPDKFELVNPLIVLEPAAIVLLVKVCVPDNVATTVVSIANTLPVKVIPVPFV